MVEVSIRRLLRPGASEVYRITVFCGLHETSHHEIVLRLRHDNYVTFEGRCDRKTARAFELLSNVATCHVNVELLRTTIRAKDTTTEVCRCATCNAYVLPCWQHVCPICQDSTFLHAIPLWNRIVRFGRVH